MISEPRECQENTLQIKMLPRTAWSIPAWVAGIWNRFLETGSAGQRPGQDRRRATTPNEDCYLVLTARRHRNMNATLLQQHLR
ncbi:transposable element Tcb2 transposase [Trichonephila clavipes]|nr:transposable element Tcb2 transposase [Trichonephila clavipes]